jgi:hypothetical protein
MPRTRCLSLLLLLAACGGDPSTQLPPIAPAPPAAPAQDDPSFQVQAKRWLMLGDPLTPADPAYVVQVNAPGEVGFVDFWIDQEPGRRISERGPDGAFHATVSPPPVAGDHQVIFAADGRGSAFAGRPLHVSAALYAVVSTDWDDSDNLDAYLHNIEMLRAAHPQLMMTQFFGPYVLTDPDTTPERKQVNTAWIQNQRDQFGDEIGVHIHPYCNFVSSVTMGGAPMTCRTMPSTVYPTGDLTGYTVIFAAYTTDEQEALLRGAADLLEQHGLGRPTSFRAGGWTAQLSTIQACARVGYTVESSALPADTIQQAWMGYVLATWNAMNWMGITTTSQPYHPSQMNLVSSQPAPDFSVLEVPDNGCLVDYMTGDQMIAVLHQIWPDQTRALAMPHVFQTGFHPPDFNGGFRMRMDAALTEVDRYLLRDDAGPIVYARLRDLASVF